MGARERLLEHPAVYSAWQAPFAAQKFAPVERWLRDHKIRRVLDVGCGAGTNAQHFTDVDYVGLDVNERYLEVARARFPRPVRPGRSDERRSLVARHVRHDSRQQLSSSCERSDVERILAQLSPSAGAGRHDPHPRSRPASPQIARLGDGAARSRPLRAGRSSGGARCSARRSSRSLFEPYFFGGRLWSMVYFQGRRKP